MKIHAKTLLFYYIGYIKIKDLMLVPTNESKKKKKNVKNYGRKLENIFGQ